MKKVWFILCLVSLLLSACSSQAQYDGKSIWIDNEAVMSEHMTMLSDTLETAFNNEGTKFRWLMSEGTPTIKKATIDGLEQIEEVKELIKSIKLSEEYVDFTYAALEHPVIILSALNDEQEIFSWAFYGNSPMLYYNDGRLADGTVAKGYEITNYEEVKSKIDALIQKAEFTYLGS